MNKQEYFTDSPVHPGEHLKDTLDELSITQTQLADRSGLSRKLINEIIQGKARISPSTAIVLERILKVPAQLWNNLQQNYDLNIAYLTEQEKIKQESELLKLYPIKKMMEYGWIKQSNTVAEKTESLYEFFKVASLRNIEKSIAVQFRRSFNNNISKESIFAWLRQGEIEIKEIETREYRSDKLKQLLPQLRLLTCTEPSIFTKEIKLLCASTGIAVAFIPELPRTYINGATFWLNDLKTAAILLSLRFKSNDHLWFSFFHEIGHILLHKKREKFLDLDNPRLSQEETNKETEADQFAADLLIPPDDWNELKKVNRYTRAIVSSFARKISIAPGIVVGRLQKEGCVPYSHLNGLKAKYKWDINH